MRLPKFGVQTSKLLIFWQLGTVICAIPATLLSARSTAADDSHLNGGEEGRAYAFKGLSSTLAHLRLASALQPYQVRERDGQGLGTLLRAVHPLR